MENTMSPEAYLEMENLEKTHWWYHGRRKVIKEQISLLDLPENASILEIGCGTGGNLKMLSAYGHVSAIETNDFARKVAIKNNKNIAEIYPGSAPNNIPFKNVKFDLICMFDVLEHIEDELSTLNALKKILAPNGKIILTVPAYQWLWSTHDEYHHHYRRYSKKNIIFIASELGFYINKISFFNTLLFPIAAAMRLLTRVINKKNHTQTNHPSRFINKILITIFSSESKILKISNFPFGLSLIAVFTKKKHPQLFKKTNIL